MRLATLKSKIATNGLLMKDIESIYNRLCNEITNGNKAAILNHLLDVYKAKMAKYIGERSDLNAAQYTLTITHERYIILMHSMTETVIYAYGGPYGGYESTMYCYYDKTGHVQTRSYQFWNDQGLSRLFSGGEADGKQNSVTYWHLLHGDALRYMTKYLPSKDLLACTLVCAAWRRNLLHDSVWRPRLGGHLLHRGPIIDNDKSVLFRQFICSFALLSDLEPTTIESCLVKNMQAGLAVLSNIASAWRFKNSPFLAEVDILKECIVETYPALSGPAGPAGPAVFEDYGFATPERGGGGSKKRLSILVEMEEARKKLKTANACVKRINTIRRFIDITSMEHALWHNRAKTYHVNAFMAGIFKHDGEEGALVWITGDGKLKLANLKNAKGCETGDNVKEVLHNMMLAYADSLYFPASASASASASAGGGE
jgi:hypothetical protein